MSGPAQEAMDAHTNWEAAEYERAMMRHSPELIDRVRRALRHAFANHDHTNGSAWTVMADAALEASGHAELLEVLKVAADTLRPEHLYPGTREEWENHQRDTGEWFDELLAKHGISQ